MEIKIFNKVIIIKYQIILISLLIVLWSFYHYFSIVSNPRGGADSVLFIKPLTIILFIAFLGIVYDSITIKKDGISGEVNESDSGSEMFDKRRLFFAVSLILYAVLFTFFGYIVPSIIFVFAVSYYLGLRKIWLNLLISFTIPLLFGLFFKYTLQVPIPLWPI